MQIGSPLIASAANESSVRESPSVRRRRLNTPPPPASHFAHFPLLGSFDSIGLAFGRVIRFRRRSENAEVEGAASVSAEATQSRESSEAMSNSIINRRQWIQSVARATVISGVVAPGMFWVVGDASAADKSGDAVLLVADPSRDLFRVRVELDIEGNVNVPKNALVSKEQSVQVPVRSNSVLDWEERIIGFAGDGSGQAAERFYYAASSSGKVGKKDQGVTLRPQSQSVRVRRDNGQWVVYSADTYLDAQEIDLLKVPATSLALDAILPKVAVRVGDKYSPDREVLAKLLCLAAVDQTTVVGEVKSIDDSQAKIHLTGKVDGSINGVPTTIDLVAKLVFDREQAACTWLAMAIRENREIGKSEPGFDIAGTVRLVRKPIAAPVRLRATSAGDFEGSIPADRLFTEFSSSAVGYAVLMDRRWKIMTDAAGVSMMRMIEDDRGVAQVNFRPLGKLAAGAQLTLEAFVGESKLSMGDRFGEVLQSEEDVNAAGLRVLRVSIQGAVQDVPIQWVFLHFSDDEGRRLLATVTVANEHLDTYAGSDIQLGASLRFLPLDDETIGVATKRSGRSGVK